VGCHRGKPRMSTLIIGSIFVSILLHDDNAQNCLRQIEAAPVNEMVAILVW